MKIGILGYQGSIEEHECVLHRLHVDTIRVKKPVDLQNIDGIILPGGESTHMLRAMHFTGLFDALTNSIKNGLPTLATCAGVILLSQNIDNTEQETMGLFDITVSRNGYGSQYFSSVEEVHIEGFTKKYRAVFIRAPIVRSVGKNCKVLSTDAVGNPIFIQQQHMFALTFHPELTSDDRIHSLFIKTIL